MNLFYLFLFVQAESIPSPVIVDKVEAIPVEILTIKEEQRQMPIGIQMKELTTPLLGSEYLIDAAGEAKEPDLDPIVRYDAFDCLTFVEEAMALAIGNSLEEADQIRQSLRYQGAEISYDERNHFMLSQWIPNAVNKGYLVDITHTIGDTHLVSKAIKSNTWSHWRGRHKYPFSLDQYPIGIYNLGVLSLDTAISNIDKIPEGSLIIVIRQNKDYNPLLITHVGFVVRYSDTDIRIRHATKMAGGTVKDNYLIWYLDYIRYYDRWPVEGVIILEPQDPKAEVRLPE
jgi:hypothetical protein